MRLCKNERTDIRGVGFDSLTLDEAADALKGHLEGGAGLAAVYTPNPEIVEAAVADETGRLYEVVNSAELVIPDGVGIVKAAKILKTPLKCKVAGIELGERMIEYAASSGVGVYFLGGKPGIAERAAERLTEKYSGLNVCGVADGYFKKTGEESERAISKIAEAGPRLLFVCLGAPAQEIWIYDNKPALEAAGVSVAMGLGGALDVFAGEVKRAPKVFIALGLEWFWRLLREPWRWRRMLALPRFYFAVRKEAKNRKG